MTESTAQTVTFRDLQIGDIGWIVARHGELYAAEHGFDASFEPLVARILADFAEHHDPARERAWVACRGAQRLGTIFCVQGDVPDRAKLRLFWLEPWARGQGVAQRLLDQCLGFARAVGYREMRLWTHESHVAAGRLYAKAGFRLIDARPVRSFGQDLVEQTWHIPF